MRLWDTANGYGWLSIALHWLTAAIVAALWLIGSMAQTAEPADYASLVELHTSLAVSAYAFLLGRIAWRFAVGHPGALPKQSRVFFTIGKYFHFLLLGAIVVMLVSGPMMVWAGGQSIAVFGLSLPSPLGPLPALHETLRQAHGVTGGVILLGTALHIAAAVKHMVVDKDGTFDKIMVAASDRPTLETKA